jgi:hypothetical protein
MMLSNKSILLVSPEPWDHIFVSKHHYAVYLGRRNNKVFFLNPPGKSTSVVDTDYKNVRSVHYTGFPSGLRFYPRPLQQHFILRKFRELEKLCDTAFDIVWSFDNSVFFDFSCLPKSVLAISHIVDLNQDFQTRASASTANICFCTTDLIRERLIKYNKRCFKINHGFHVASPDDTRVALPGSSKVKVLYAGNLAMPYIDWGILSVVVRDNPNVDFIFIGPNMSEGRSDAAARQVRNAQNAYFLGRVHPDRLLSHYRAADILILTYQEKYHADQANPHKMMEYLGSGQMIVATQTMEFRELNDTGLLLMSNDNTEFPRLLLKAMNDLEYWNQEAKINARKQWALNNTYERQIERIEMLLNSHTK